MNPPITLSPDPFPCKGVASKIVIPVHGEAVHFVVTQWFTMNGTRVNLYLIWERESAIFRDYPQMSFPTCSGIYVSGLASVFWIPAFAGMT